MGLALLFADPIKADRFGVKVDRLGKTWAVSGVPGLGPCGHDSLGVSVYLGLGVVKPAIWRGLS